ncbi:HAD family hydrolase [Paenibacillus massiliensis]|uniref:HAD family hydrolase n=1 Tax=Paenibacillus massiliensis TaxID=225917 RepID=UPI00037CE3A6|nr:HAD family hydrolase [Paenibacillus massiliensis]
MTTTVLFDLDNTLANRRHAFDSFTRQFIEDFLATSDIGTSSMDNEAALMETIRIADRNGYRSKRELFQELLCTLPFKDERVTVRHLLEYWYSEFAGHTTMMQGAEELLHDLRAQGFRLGLITNGSVAVQNRKLDQLQLRAYFETVIVSQAVRLDKPDRRIFELALQRMKVSPQETWYVGDHPVNDVQGASRAGLRTVWLEGFEEWPDEVIECPQHTIRQLSELHAWNQW